MKCYPPLVEQWIASLCSGPSICVNSTMYMLSVGRAVWACFATCGDCALNLSLLTSEGLGKTGYRFADEGKWEYRQWTSDVAWIEAVFADRVRISCCRHNSEDENITVIVAKLGSWRRDINTPRQGLLSHATKGGIGQRRVSLPGKITCTICMTWGTE